MNELLDDFKEMCGTLSMKLAMGSDRWEECLQLQADVTREKILFIIADGIDCIVGDDKIMLKDGHRIAITNFKEVPAVSGDHVLRVFTPAEESPRWSIETSR